MYLEFMWLEICEVHILVDRIFTKQFESVGMLLNRHNLQRLPQFLVIFNLLVGCRVAHFLAGSTASVIIAKLTHWVVER